MHTLIKFDLKKLEIVSEQHSRKYHDDWYGRGGSNYHRIGDYYPYTIRDRVIKKFLNKSYDQAFAYFCTLVPQYQQKEFADGFVKECDKHWNYRHYEIVNGIIRKIEKGDSKKLVTFYSDDYTGCYQHKVTGQTITKDEWYSKRAWVGRGRWNHEWVWIKREDYELVTLTGWKQEFESSKDPRFIRLTQERLQRKRLQKKQEERAKKKRNYCFLTKDELQKKWDESESRLIRDRHDFDKTTFMGIEYHGQKRKLKTT